MIYDKLENLSLYFDENSAFSKAIDFIKNFSGSPGKYQIDGDSLYVNIDEYTTSSEKDKQFEAHKKYVDIQVMLSGLEIHGVMAQDEGNFSYEGDYDDQKDIAFMDTVSDYSRLLLSPGEFVVYYPNDCHKPGCSVDSGTRVKKAVAKVLIEG